jgi:hypothetical protein
MLIPSSRVTRVYWRSRVKSTNITIPIAANAQPSRSRPLHGSNAPAIKNSASAMSLLSAGRQGTGLTQSPNT